MGLLDLLRPKPIERSPSERRQLAEETAGLSLYCSPWCGYCRIVERTMHRLGLEIEVRNVASERDAYRDLVEGGGPGGRCLSGVGCVRSAVGPDARRRARRRCGAIVERAQRSRWAHAARTLRAPGFAAPGREDSSVNVVTDTPPSLFRTRNRRSRRAATHQKSTALPSQVPCLRIDEDGRVQWLYESRDIAGYLQRRFAPVEAVPQKV